MNLRPWIPILALGLLGAVPQQDVEPRAAEDARAFLTSWCRAIESEDVDRVIHLYEGSPEALVISSLGAEYRGPRDIRSMYVQACQEVDFLEVRFEGLEVRRRGSVAWATGKLHAKSQLRADETRWKLAVRATFVLVREGDGWRISLEHASVIPGTDRVQKVVD